MSSDQTVLIKILSWGLCHSNFETASDWCLTIPNLTINKSSVYLLCGENMSGKSTLLRLLARQHAAAKTDPKWDSFESEMQSIPTILSAADDPMFRAWSVRDNVNVACPTNGSVNKCGEQSLRNLLNRINTQYEWKMKIEPESPLFQYSTGARAFIQLARAVVFCPALYLVDEVTANLDDQKASFFIQTVCNLVKERGTSLIMVSHSNRDHEYVRNQAKGLDIPIASLRLMVNGGGACLQED